MGAPGLKQVCGDKLGVIFIDGKLGPTLLMREVPLICEVGHTTDPTNNRRIWQHPE